MSLSRSCFSFLVTLLEINFMFFSNYFSLILNVVTMCEWEVVKSIFKLFSLLLLGLFFLFMFKHIIAFDEELNFLVFVCSIHILFQLECIVEILHKFFILFQLLLFLLPFPLVFVSNLVLEFMQLHLSVIWVVKLYLLSKPLSCSPFYKGL